MKTTIDVRYLNAAAICAHRESTRYYLNGVLVEPSPDGLLLVATDGNRLICLHHECEVVDPVPPFIIPLRMCSHKVRRVSLFDRKRKADANLAGLDIENGIIRISHDGMTAEMPEIDGTYPQWRKAIPDTLNGEASTVNGQYLYDFQRIKKIFGDNNVPAVSHNGQKAIIVHLGAMVKGFGVLMPVRTDAPKWEMPEWATEAQR